MNRIEEKQAIEADLFRTSKRGTYRSGNAVDGGNQVRTKVSSKFASDVPEKRRSNLHKAPQKALI